MLLTTPPAVADKYGVSIGELARLRRVGIWPAYYRIGPRLIPYTSDDVEAWFHDPAHERWHDFPTRVVRDDEGQVTGGRGEG